MVTIIIVMATKNEQDTIWALLDKLRDYTVVIVDDSTDSTRNIIKLFSNTALIPGAGRGIAHAYLTGFTYALSWHPGQPILQMDAGFTHRPEDIEKFKPCAGVVLGQRKFPAVGWRPFISRMASFLAGIPLRDVTCGFRLWHPEVLAEIIPSIKCKGNAFQIEMLAEVWNNSVTAKEVEIPYILTNSHLRPWMMYEALRLVCRKKRSEK